MMNNPKLYLTHYLIYTYININHKALRDHFGYKISNYNIGSLLTRLHYHLLIFYNGIHDDVQLGNILDLQNKYPNTPTNCLETDKYLYDCCFLPLPF